MEQPNEQQPSDQQPIVQQSFGPQPTGSSSSSALEFSLADPVEVFDIASDQSDGTASESHEADLADDNFWWNEFHIAEGESSPAAVSKRPAQPLEEDARPSKQHRTG